MPKMTIREAFDYAPVGFGHYGLGSIFRSKRVKTIAPLSANEILSNSVTVREGFLQNIDERTTRDELDQLIRAVAHLPLGRLTTVKKMSLLKEDIVESMKLRVPVQLLYFRRAGVSINSAYPQQNYPIRSVSRATLEERTAKGERIIDNLALMDDDYWVKLLRDIESFELDIKDAWIEARHLFSLYAQRRRFDMTHTHVDPLLASAIRVGYEPNFERGSQVCAALVEMGLYMEAHADELHLTALVDDNCSQ